MTNFIKKHKILFSIAFNILIFAVYLCFAPMKYEMLDDYLYVSDFINNEVQVRFISVFVFNIICFLQQIFTTVNVYTISMLGLSIISYATITYVLVDRLKSTSLYLSLATIAAMSSICYTIISFTRTASILLISGFMLIAHNIIFSRFYLKKHSSFLQLVFAIVLIIIGFLIRKNTFYIALGVFLVYVFSHYLIDFLKSVKENKVSTEKNTYTGLLSTTLKKLFSLRNILIATVVLVSFFGLTTASSLTYNCSDQRDFHLRYDQLRSSLGDFNIPSYEQYIDEYTELGIDKNDFHMFLNFYYDDEGSGKFDTLEQIHELRLKDTVRSVKTTLFQMAVLEKQNILTFDQSGVLLLVYIFFVFLGILCLNGYDKIYALGTIIPTGVFYYYLYDLGRPVFRVVFSFLLFSILFILYSLGNEKFKLKINNLIAYSVTFLFLISFVFSVIIYDIKLYKAEDVESVKNLDDYVTTEMQENDARFVLSVSSYKKVRQCNPAYCNPLLLPSEKDDLDKKCLYFAFTYLHTPYYEDKLRSYGVSNLYRDIVDNDNLYLIDLKSTPHIQMLSEYAHKWYYSDKKDVIAKEKAEFGNYVVYQLYSVNG